MMIPFIDITPLIGNDNIVALPTNGAYSSELYTIYRTLWHWIEHTIVSDGNIGGSYPLRWMTVDIPTMADT